MNKYVLFCSKSDWFRYMFYDSFGDKHFFISKNGISPFGSQGPIGLLNSILYSQKIEKKLRIPKFIKRLTYRTLISKRKLNNCENVFFIFTDSNRLSHDQDFINYCRKKIKKVVVVRWFLDLMDISLLPESEEVSFCKKNFDIIVDYDRDEALKYGFYFVESPYSRALCFEPKEPCYDVVFIGTAKIQRDSGLRYNKIIKAYESLIRSGLSVKFYVHGVPAELQKYTDGIVYNKYLPYEKVLELNSMSRCILEITQTNETGTTLRLFESIAYKKKLLIDNEKIVKNPLFDDKNMKIFKDNESVDVDFIRSEYIESTINREKISPNVFFNSLISIYNEIRRNSQDE